MDRRTAAPGASTTPLIAPRRIAIYLHTLFNGGIERVMFELMREWLARGIRVDLVVDLLEYSPMRDKLPAGTRLVELGAGRFVQRVPRLVEYLRRERPDAMLVATHFANEVAALSTRLSGTGTRLLLSEHTTLSSDLRGIPRGNPRAWIPRTARIAYAQADAVVSVSEGVAADLRRLTGITSPKLHTIYNPLDVDAVRRSAAEPLDHPWFPRDLRPSENDAERIPVIIGIGRLELQKDFANMLRAFALVRENRPARLLILGEGSQHAALTAQVAKLGLQGDVLMPGFVANPHAYLARSSVFALSSAWEGLPIAVMEALAVGTPVVATDCPSGPSELLAGGKYGDLVPVGDSDALASAILKALDGQAKSVDAAWLDQFHPRTVADKYLRLMSR